MEDLSYVFTLPYSFLWGFAGSMAVEIIAVHESWNAYGNLPIKYRAIEYWLVRFLVACVGGGLAFAYGAENNFLLAAYIGVSAPAIIHLLKNKVRLPPTCPD